MTRLTTSSSDRPCFDQLGDVVVAEDAGRRRLERARADRRRDEDGVVPRDRRRPAAALHVDAPRDVVLRRPRRRQLAVEDAGARRPAKLRPRHRRLEQSPGPQKAQKAQSNLVRRSVGAWVHASTSIVWLIEFGTNRVTNWLTTRVALYSPRAQCAGHSSARSPERSGSAFLNQPKDASLPSSVLSRGRRSQLERLALATAALAARARSARARAASLGRRASRAPAQSKQPAQRHHALLREPAGSIRRQRSAAPNDGDGVAGVRADARGIDRPVARG